MTLAPMLALKSLDLPNCFKTLVKQLIYELIVPESQDQFLGQGHFFVTSLFQPIKVTKQIAKIKIGGQKRFF